MQWDKIFSLHKGLFEQRWDNVWTQKQQVQMNQVRTISQSNRTKGCPTKPPKITVTLPSPEDTSELYVELSLPTLSSADTGGYTNRECTYYVELKNVTANTQYLYSYTGDSRTVRYSLLAFTKYVLRVVIRTPAGSSPAKETNIMLGKANARYTDVL